MRHSTLASFFAVDHAFFHDPSGFPSLADTKILTLPGRDYGYRLIVAKAVWAEALKELAKEQTYCNFKSEAAKNQGQTGADYTRALHDVWEIMYDLQGGKTRHGGF